VNLLLLTFRSPYPPDRGDRLAAYHLLRAASARHRVTLVTFVEGTEPPGTLEHLSAMCARVETVRLSRARSWLQAWLALPTPTPSQVRYFDSSEMRARLARVLSEAAYDIVVAHAIRTGPYVERLDHPAKVLWVCDSLGLVLRRSMSFAPGWKRPGLAWEARRVDRYEARLARAFRETWAIAPADVRDLERLGCPRVALVPNGVDERLFEVERRPAQPPRVVFLGNLSVPHNVDAAVFAARDVWPRVRSARPRARLVLAGAEPSPAVRGLASIEGVEVTGALADLRPVWSEAAVMLAPLRFSTGLQNKLIEAMAAGVPVVTTPDAAEAAGIRDGEHAWVTDGPQRLADAVLSALADPAAAEARARAARKLVRERFTWEAAVRRLEGLAGAAPAPGAA
jgi:sugar transferase (PEP-CTERM/EpsH1 system associated)